MAGSGRCICVLMLAVLFDAADINGAMAEEAAQAEAPKTKQKVSEEKKEPIGPAAGSGSVETPRVADTDGEKAKESAPPKAAPKGEASVEAASDSSVQAPTATPVEASPVSDAADVSPEASEDGDSDKKSEEPLESVEIHKKVVSPVPVIIRGSSSDEETEKTVEEAPDNDVVQGKWTKHLLFSTRDGSFRFQPRGWVQPRFGILVNTDDRIASEDRLDGTGFGMQRARFGFQAWLFEWGRFYLDTGWKTGSPALVDYFIDVGPQNGAGPFAVRAGFFRPYFARQLLNATTQLAMIDYARAWTDSSLDLGLGISGRQLGLAVQGFVAGGFEYAVGIWNGSDGYEADADFMYGGRVAVHPLALAGAGEAARPGDESDTAHSKRPALSIGASLHLENRDEIYSEVVFDQSDGSLLPYEDIQLKTGVDAAFKIAGFSVVGEFFLVKRWAREKVIQDSLEQWDRAAPGVGLYVQAGYLVIRDRLELAARFDMVDENTAFRGARFYPSVGATVFVYGNNLKVQTQYRLNKGVNYEETDPDYIPTSHDILFMLQASI